MSYTRPCSTHDCVIHATVQHTELCYTHDRAAYTTVSYMRPCNTHGCVIHTTVQHTQLCYTRDRANHSSCCGPFCPVPWKVECLASPLPDWRSPDGSAGSPLSEGWAWRALGEGRWPRRLITGSSQAHGHEPPGSGDADAQWVLQPFLTKVTW